MRAVEDAIARQVFHGGDLITNLLEIGGVREETLMPVVAESLGLMGSARLEASLHPFRGPYLALSMQTGATSAFRESAGLLLVGYRFGLQLHRLELFAAPAIGGGGIVQAPGGSTALGALAAEVGAAYDFDGRYAIQVEGQLPADLLREDGKTKVVVLPAAWLVLRLTVG